MNTNIIVLNYNGKELMAECLPSIITASKNSKYNCAVTVLDNNSSDGSIDFLKRNFSGINIYSAKENRVLCSFNEFAKDSDADILIFMNNDIKVDADFVDPLLDHFEDKDVFFIAPKVLNFDGTFNGGKSYIKMRHGLIKVEVDNATYNKEGITHTIACGAFRRNIFLKLEGYDPVYLPGYWEDTDLCYRGLKLGLKGLYEPKSRIYHKEHASFSKKFSRYRKMTIVDRNMFIFMWKNISDLSLWTKHLLLIVPRLIFSVINGRPHLVLGFFKAIGKIPKIASKRKSMNRNYIINDSEIIK